MKGIRLSYLALALVGLMVASQAAAQLPPCDTYCTCAVPCFITQCDGGGGFIQDCSEWGFCATSCACGGECKVAETATTEIFGQAPSAACSTETDLLLTSIFN